MGAKERVMIIRLIEKLQADPALAAALGIQICAVRLSEASDKEK